MEEVDARFGSPERSAGDHPLPPLAPLWGRQVHTIQPCRRQQKRVEELQNIGVQPPLRPRRPFDLLPAHPTAEQVELDRVYQTQCVDWIEAVALLHAKHFPQGVG